VQRKLNWDSRSYTVNRQIYHIWLRSLVAAIVVALLATAVVGAPVRAGSCNQYVGATYVGTGYGVTGLCTTTDIYWHSSDTIFYYGSTSIRVYVN
jgi:hypothetical protein